MTAADLDRAEAYLSFTLAREMGADFRVEKARALLQDMGLLRAIARLGPNVSRAEVLEKVKARLVMESFQEQAKRAGME